MSKFDSNVKLSLCKIQYVKRVWKKMIRDIYFFCKPQINAQINKFLFTVNSFVSEKLSERIKDKQSLRS